MSKYNKKNLNDNSLSRILKFPNQINTLTIFLLVILYGLILGLIFNFIFPRYDYTIQLNYEPSTFNEEINPHIFIRGTATNQNDDEEGEPDIKVQFRVFAYIKQMGTVKPTNVRYAYSGLDENGIMQYFYESKKVGSSIPVSHYVVASSIYPGGGDFDKYFMKVRYDMKTGVDNENQDIIDTKEIKMAEEVIKLSKRELNYDDFTNVNTLKDLLKVKLTFADPGVTSKQYRSNIKIEINDLSASYRINMQSWLVTENNDIYPYLGLYNYSARENFAPFYETSVFKEINPKYIYMKLNYIDNNNNISQMYYKVSIEDLLSSNNS